MADENWQKIRKIFDEALHQKPEKRRTYVRQACGKNKLLLAEVESLLTSLEGADSFLETPAVGTVAGVIEAETKHLKTGKCFGHYEIIKQIGTGGMGEVYLAKDRKLERQVAVKILNPQFNKHASNLQRFIHEAKSASALNHPNILVIHEVGESEETHYIVSEFIKGKTLRDVLRDESLTLSEVLDIAVQIANALSAAHEARLVHRDIKPENVMIRPDGYVKILDFGLAKLVERKNRSVLGLEETAFKENQTAKGIILGTINYMSPEQAKGEQIDERTDIFSLGVVIYEMIAGRTPFAGDSMSETFANLINLEPQPISIHSSKVPEELQEILTKMLCKNKDQRYQTMKDLVADLKNVRENLTLVEKLERSVPPETYNTEVLQATTGDANRQTGETQNSFSLAIKQHKPLAAFASIALIIGAFTLSYYFFYQKATTLGNKKSIAVLPLKPINTANRDEIYEFGIADSLITKLGAMKGFIVRPLSATRNYSDLNQDPIAAGREQQVDYVLTSNYQLVGGKIRITAQLFNVSNGQIEETYKSEKETGDLFAMQDAIASEFGNQLQTLFALTSNNTMAKRGTNNEEAYRLYLQGRNLTMHRSVPNMKKAIENFEQAIKLDPNYALAYARMANAYLWLDFGDNVVPRTEKINEIIQKAFELDNNVAEGYVARGQLNLTFEWNFPAAEKDFLRAIELEPNNDTAHWLYALLLANRGRFDEAMTEIETAQAIDPSATGYMMHRGRILYFARRYNEAVVQFERLMDLDENAFSNWTQWAYLMKGDEKRAFEMFMKVQKKRNSEHLEIYQKAYETAGWQGIRRKILDVAKLDEQELRGGFNLAKECAMLGEKELAFEYLNKAVENRRWLISTLNVEPAFDNLRDDPRFDELVNRFGLK